MRLFWGIGTFFAYTVGMRTSSFFLLVGLYSSTGCRNADDVPLAGLGAEILAGAGTILSTLDSNGTPVVFNPDDPERRTLAVGESALYAASLSPRGQRAAICTAAPGTGEGSSRNSVMEGAIAVGIGVLETAGAYCGDVKYGPNGDMVVWGEQDEDDMMRLRVTPVGAGLRPAGDDRLRARLLFEPNFVLGGRAVAAMTSDYTDRGPIGVVDLGSGETWTLSSAQAEGELVASPDGRWLVTPDGYALRLIDVEEDTSTVIWRSLDESDGCSVSDPDRDADCFLDPNQMSFSPDSSRIVFTARPYYGERTPDLREVDLVTGAETVLTDRSRYRHYPVYGGDGMLYWIDDFQSIGRAAATEDAGDDADLLPFGSVNALRVAWPNL